MFLKVILIILGVIIMVKFLEFIKNIINIGQNIKRINGGHNEIKELLGEEGKLRIEHNEIKELLGEEGKLRIGQKEIKELLGEEGKLRIEQKEIKNILVKNGGIETKVDNILKNQEEENKLIKDLKGKDLDINNTILHINALQTNFLEQKVDIKLLKEDNLKLKEEIETLKMENIDLKNKLNNYESTNLNIESNFKIKIGNNEQLCINLLKSSNLNKEEIVEMFKDNKVVADKYGNAIFTAKDKMGNIIEGYELNLDKDEEPKLCNKDRLEKAKILANKVFKSMSKEKYRDYEQEL